MNPPDIVVGDLRSEEFTEDGVKMIFWAKMGRDLGNYECKRAVTTLKTLKNIMNLSGFDYYNVFFTNGGSYVNDSLLFIDTAGGYLFDLNRIWWTSNLWWKSPGRYDRWLLKGLSFFPKWEAKKPGTLILLNLIISLPIPGNL